MTTAQNALSTEMINGTRLNWAYVFGIVNILLFVGTSIFAGSIREDKARMIPLCLQLAVFAVFGLGGIRLCAHTTGRLQSGIDSLKDLEQLINPCVDNLTTIND